jgi:membrane protein DedA with SNARE-associated domain
LNDAASALSAVFAAVAASDGVAAFARTLQGMAQPWVIALVLALTTLLLEDLAIAAGVALAAQGAISWEASLAAVAGGIALGDLGLYALGAGATRLRWLQRRYGGAPSTAARARLASNLPFAVLLARVVPGLRLVTYTAAGFLRIAWWRFVAWVVLAVSLWTAGLYLASAALGAQLSARFGLSPPVAVALPIVLLALLFPAVRWVRRLCVQRRLGTASLP